MNRYALIKNAVAGFSIGFGIVISKLTSDLAAALSKNHGVIYAVFFISFTIAYFIVKNVCDFSFYTFVGLRRLLLGRFYVEGKWVEQVRKNGLRYCIGIVQFTMNEYSFQLSGTNYTPSGVPLNTFNSSVSLMNWPTVHFQHDNRDTQKKGDPAIGLGVVTFIEDSPAPRKYTAHYHHDNSTDEYSVEARRIFHAEESDVICDPSQLPKFIRQEWDKFSPS